MKPKFKVGDELITTGPSDGSKGRIIVVVEVTKEVGTYWYRYIHPDRPDIRATWSEPNLRKVTKLDKALKQCYNLQIT